MKKYLLPGFLWVFSTIAVHAQTPPTLTAGVNVTVDTDFEITFADDGIWQAGISEISFGDDVLDAGAYDTTTKTGSIIFSPSASIFFQNDTTLFLKIVSGAYDIDSVEQSIAHGVASEIEIVTQPSSPAGNGSELETQPSVKVIDQYGNHCTSDNTTNVVAAVGNGAWLLGGTVTGNVTAGMFSYSDLTASSNVAVTGATIAFSSTVSGVSGTSSSGFDIALNSPPALTAAIGATVDASFGVLYTDDPNWETSIDSIFYNNVKLVSGTDYSVDITGDSIVFNPSENAILQNPGTEDLVVYVAGYSPAIISQSIEHGSAASMFISTQPNGPTQNGGDLVTQPTVILKDTYDNDCTSDNTSEITASESGGTWFLDGVKQFTASGGVFIFTNLQARSDTELTTATITFSSGTLDDQISNTFTIPALQSAPQLLASSTATVDGEFEVVFSANNNWQLAIDSISYGGITLAEAAYDKSQSAKIIFDPSLDPSLQSAGTESLEIHSRGYETAVVSQEIKHGAVSEMAIVLQPTAPDENGALLANQPVLTLKDQYSNDCTSENTLEITAAKGDANDWTLGGTRVKQFVNGSVSYTDLTASSNEAVAGVFIAFSASGLPTVNSATFDIPELTTPPVLTAASNANVDENFYITFTDNPTWRNQITEIRYGTELLPDAAYDTSGEGVITFKPAESPILQTVANEYLFIFSTSFLKDSVQQEIAHGAAASITITTQPTGPDNNGDQLQTQPIVKIQDQYLNDCITNNEQTIEANATGGSWIVEGTTSIMVTNGIVEFTNLTARSTDLVTNATITFSGTGLTSQESDFFTVPAPLFAPSLIASTTATVDSLFDVTFIENAAWQGSIDSVFYGGSRLNSNSFDKTQAGKIIFDPSKDAEMQVPATKEILVFSRGYENASVNQEIKHGVPDTLIVEIQATAPLINGGDLDVQPKISVRDQYNNTCSSENSFEVTVAKGDAQDWVLGGTTTQAVSSGVINYSDLSASSDNAVTGAFLIFTGAGITPVNSDPFDIPDLLDPPNINAALTVTVDEDFSLRFSNGDDWSSSITVITYAGDTLPSVAYDIDSESIAFHISEEVLLQKAGTFEIVIHALGYRNALVEQEVGHGIVASMEITQQPLAPPSNGDLLRQQPVLRMLDQYNNLCSSENNRSVTAARNDSGDWNLAGTMEQTAIDGNVTFTDLSVYSSGAVSGAVLQFSSTGLDSQVSDPFDIPDVSSSPILTTATGATVDNSFAVSFTEDSVWRSRINVITVNDSVLVAESYNTTQAGKLELIPSASEFLQKSGSFQIVVQSRGFAHDTVQQNIQHGVADSLLITTQPTGPDNNGGLLAQQPKLKLEDQYLNDCITDNLTLIVVEKYDQKDWELGGTLELQAQEGVIGFTDLTATSEIAVDSVYLKLSFAGDTVISNLFTIPVPVIELTAVENASVDNKFTIHTSDNSSWRDSISAISFAGETLADTAYLVKAGSITFYPARDSILQIARTDTIIVVANAYADAIVEQLIQHGTATKMVIVDQPIGPENNGDTLAQQPSLQLKDQYQNNCDNDNATQVLASKYSDGTETDVVDLWDLGGTKTTTAIEGMVKFLTLTATSEDRVEGARLLFASDELLGAVSDSFDIVIPPPPVIVGAENTNVDESFFVEFSDNKTWRSLIYDIRYGIRSMEGNYDISVPGKISFDPLVTSILQKSGVDTISIYSGNYDTVRFEQVIHHGKSKYMVIIKEPSAPLTNGDVLLRQPQLKLQDQYRNNCETDSETPVAVKKGDDGDWILAGTFTQIADEGIVNYTDLTAASELEVEGARLEFEATGLMPKLSQSFTIPEPQGNRAGQATANPELVCYGASSNLTLVGFDGEIQWQKYNEFDEVYEDLDGENSEIYVTDEIVQHERYRAVVSKEDFATQHSNSVTVSPIEPPIADFSFEIDYNQVDFTNLSTNATSITWNFGDGVISSEFEPSHSFVLDNADGTGYVVSLTASNEACPDSEKSQQIFITTGIEDLIAETGVVVYPNPSSGEFFIGISNSDEEGVLRIFDQSGKLVATRNIANGFQTNRIAFDLKTLTGGLYFVSIQYPDKVIRAKLIIK